MEKGTGSGLYTSSHMKQLAASIVAEKVECGGISAFLGAVRRIQLGRRLVAHYYLLAAANEPN